MNKTLSYPVTAQQLDYKRRSVFFLWNGEVIATVMRNVGAYGHYSAVIVVEHIDSPYDVYDYDGFVGGANKPTGKDMNTWIANELTKLATGKQFAEGAVGSIEECSDTSNIGDKQQLA